jgi:Flp pilus assembly protein TadB
MQPGGETRPGAERQPRFRNPAKAPDTSAEKQSELKLNVGIGVLGTILSLFSAAIFFFIEEVIVLGIVFVVVALVSAAITARVYGRLKRARTQSDTAERPVA